MSQQRNVLRRLAGETAVYGLADAVGKGLSILLFPVFTRILTPSEYGVMEVIGTVTFLLSAMLMLGLDSATTRHYYSAEYRDRQGVVLGSSLMFSALVYFGGVLPVLFGSQLLTKALFGTAQYHTAVLLAIAAIPFTLLTGFHLNTLRRLLRPWWFAGLSLFSLTLTISLNLLFIWKLRWGVPGVYAATLIGGSITAVAGMLWTRRAYQWQWDRRIIASLLRFGIPLVPASLCLWGLSLLDRLFLVRFSTLTEVGLYSTANRLSTVLGFGVAAFQMAWGPFAYSISTEGESRLVYARVLSYYVAWGGFGVLGLSLFAREALWVLTPPSYHGAALAVAPLAFGVLGYGAYTLVAIGVNLANRTSQVSLTLIGATVVNLALCIALIPRFGMMGAATATAVGWIAAAVLLGIASQRAYWIPYRWWEVARVIVLLAACIAGGLLLAGTGGPTLGSLGAKAAAVGIYVLVLKWWSLLPDLSGRWWAPKPSEEPT